MTGHDNFVQTMQSQVGKSAHDPSTIRNRYPNLKVGSQILSNGNVEEEFRIGGPECRVFFEVEKATEKIVRWRYQGSDRTCFIAV